MKWQDVCEALFGPDHGIVEQDELLRGSAVFDGEPLDVLGTTHHAAIGYAMALRQARAVLDTVQRSPGRTLLLLVDTQGQRLRRHDELLGIHRAMAHLGCTVDLARRRGHRVLGLVYDQALSGGFITSGLLADACHALPEAEIRVMRLPAMARVTKLPQELLEQLSVANPVFAPGVENYVAMGGVASLWRGDLAEALRRSLAQLPAEDRRMLDGVARGGRKLAAATVQRVLDAA
ncbi:biotin-independent malonate decarboxylase subunit gamma [Ramlibacter sp. Leaf400]|uniref:biotin-independent malonate decarboxylase subunit gamma n=1 Tax=Ramlibacter sp. Leaf400 TaxID=1736365 RepID=UPI0006FD501A|nr:biotin-independent malonate decarboxylase subunit gamma [Ramlibacter sp. Leaf400]KQT11323.1 biotin-independent malonate decarboxylase subunit gamma [Ramlibacter sp. Leaf400]